MTHSLHKQSGNISFQKSDAPIIVVARSARILVESLQRGGIETIAVDEYGDLDTRIGATRFFLIDTLSPDTVVSTIESLGFTEKPSVIYGSGVDNNPELLAQLRARYKVLGNSAQTVKQVRDPRLFFKLLDDLEISYPPVSFDSPLGCNWLVKRYDQEGGLGICPVKFMDKDDVDDQCYFQQQLDGVPFSVLFLANGKSSSIIGLHTQWFVGEDIHSPYLFQGLVNRFDVSDEQLTLIEHWVDSIVSATGLQGLNSLDCLNVNGDIVVLEINPRPSASVALYDADYPTGLLEQHINSFNDVAWTEAISQNQVRGNWIVYAPCDFRIAEGVDWPCWVSDIPVAGNEFKCGEPICTLNATAASIASVKQSLAQRSIQVADLLGCPNSSFEISMN
jgi:methenyltetrahydromethanopterin cyclohydrolase